jgi:hypothetical protein
LSATQTWETYSCALSCSAKATSSGEKNKLLYVMIKVILGVDFGKPKVQNHAES